MKFFLIIPILGIPTKISNDLKSISSCGKQRNQDKYTLISLSQYTLKKTKTEKEMKQIKRTETKAIIKPPLHAKNSLKRTTPFA
jgi:hypothetical protein